jgi:predicted ABC-type ATPase
MDEPDPQLVVIAGPNGAGKSTLAPSLLRDRFGPVEFVNADTIAQGLSAFRPESVAVEADRVMLRRLRSMSSRRESFAFETTLASRSYAPWLAELRGQGYEVHLLFLWLRSAELAVQRVHERVRLGGHDVQDVVIRRRYLRGARNFFRLYRALSDAWVIYDNSNVATSVAIASGSIDGAVTVFDEIAWQEFTRLNDENSAPDQ